jgi:hypothetical protein
MKKKLQEDKKQPMQTEEEKSLQDKWLETLRKLGATNIIVDACGGITGSLPITGSQL